MEQAKSELKSSKDVKLLHLKIVNGCTADVNKVANSLREWKKTTKLPFDVEIIVTSDVIELQGVDMLLEQLIELKKQIIDAEKKK